MNVTLIGLCCDVVTYEFEEKKYKQVLVYSEGNLHRFSIPNDFNIECTDFIGSNVSLTAEMREYNGKNKFKLVDIANA